MLTAQTSRMVAIRVNVMNGSNSRRLRVRLQKGSSCDAERSRQCGQRASTTWATIPDTRPCDKVGSSPAVNNDQA